MSAGGESSIGCTAEPSAEPAAPAAGVAAEPAAEPAAFAPAAGAGAFFLSSFLGCASVRRPAPVAITTTLAIESKRPSCMHRRYTGKFVTARLAVPDPPGRACPRRARGIDLGGLVAQRQRRGGRTEHRDKRTPRRWTPGRRRGRGGLLHWVHSGASKPCTMSWSVSF